MIFAANREPQLELIDLPTQIVTWLPPNVAVQELAAGPGIMGTELLPVSTRQAKVAAVEEYLMSLEFRNMDAECMAAPDLAPTVKAERRDAALAYIKLGRQLVRVQANNDVSPMALLHHVWDVEDGVYPVTKTVA